MPMRPIARQIRPRTPGRAVDRLRGWLATNPAGCGYWMAVLAVAVLLAAEIVWVLWVVSGD